MCVGELVSWNVFWNLLEWNVDEFENGWNSVDIDGFLYWKDNM